MKANLKHCKLLLVSVLMLMIFLIPIAGVSVAVFAEEAEPLYFNLKQLVILDKSETKVFSYNIPQEANGLFTF